MRVLLQRVTMASVTINQLVHASIGYGILVLCGFEESDSLDDLEWTTNKISQLRIFDDENGVMNCSVMETGGELLVVSQFTLHALTQKGNRPSYIRAARPEKAIPLYEQFCEMLHAKSGKDIKTGVFGAHMQVQLINDGPVTIWLNSKNKGY